MRPTLVGPDGVDALVEALQGAERIGVDTEFHAERRFVPELYLVQVAVPGVGAFVIDPRVPHVLERLGPSLLRPLWIVHGGHFDLRLLHAVLGGVPERLFDTQVAAGLVAAAYPAPYGSLVHVWLGRTIDKAETLSDWSRRPLTESQLRYAAEDVLLLDALYQALDQALEARGRRALAEAAFEDERRRALELPDDGDAWQQIGAGAILDGQELAVLQELAAWREETARMANQPPRSVLPDAAVVDLARRQPITADSVLASRRLPKSLARHAEELSERIARARQRPAWAWPRRIRRRTSEARVCACLQLWSGVVGERDAFAGELALPPSLAERIALSGLRERADLAAMLGPWRDALVGDQLWAAWTGSWTLAIVDGDLAPIPRAPTTR